MKFVQIPLAAALCATIIGAFSANATDVVINVAPEDTSLGSPVPEKVYTYENGEPLSESDKAELMRQQHIDPVGRKNKTDKESSTEKSWFGKMFSDDNEQSTQVDPSLNFDEETILQNKEFLDPDEHIEKSKKVWEQSLLKKKPDLIKEPYVFFNTKPSVALSSRMYIDERSGKIYFLVKQGSLKSNLNALMKETRNTKHLIWKVGNHKVFAENWVSGSSMFEVVNNLIAPYKQPDQVMFGVFLGNTIGVFYRADKEFWL